MWEREHDVQKVMTLLMRHMNAIAVMLMEQPEDFEPTFLQRSYEGKTYTIVDEWCEGYMRAVALAADRWELDASHVRAAAVRSTRNAAFNDPKSWERC